MTTCTSASHRRRRDGAADPARGIRQFNVGTGGRSHYSIGTIKPNSQSREVSTYGVLRLDLKAGSYDFRFVPEAGRSFTDAGSGTCHDADGAVTRSGPLNGTLTTTTFTDTNVRRGTEYHYVVTAVDGAGTKSPVSATASVTVTGGPTQPVTYALDTFSRTVVDGFGSASPGGTYSLMGTGADFDVAAGTGTISLAGPNANRAASLTSVSAQDLDLSFRFATNKLATGSGQYIYGVARRVSATASYRIKVRLTSGGAVWVGASSVTNNVESPIAAEVRAPNVTHVAGGFIRVRAQLTGTNPTTIRVRAWADGSTEPSTWTYTATNSAAGLQAPGGVGLQAYLSSSTTNAPVLVSVDDLRATGVGGRDHERPARDPVGHDRPLEPDDERDADRDRRRHRSRG